MARHKWMVILVVVLVTGGAVYLFMSGKEVEDELIYRQLLDDLKHQNDSLTRANRQLGEQLTYLFRQADSLMGLVRGERKQIDNLKKQKHESLKAIDHFDNDELLRFFTELRPDSAAH